MTGKIISLFGALALMVSFGVRAENNLSPSENALINDVTAMTLSNLDEQGLSLSGSNTDQFLLDSVTKLLGLSKGKEEARAQGMEMKDASGDRPKARVSFGPADMGIAPAANSMDDEINLDTAQGQYFLLDTIKNVVSSIFGGGSKSTSEQPAANFMDDQLSLSDANAHYGAISDAAKNLVGAIKDKVASGAEKFAGLLRGNKGEEESMENSLDLNDTSVEYGAVTDALKGLVGAIAGKVASGAEKIKNLVTSGSESEELVE
ncbi:MAG: hypothetical protein KC505_05180 [Myxococcales bacterium]|nr:hypothetical protein [Myxococcales bacterium]USN49868.1 MAG: hypothetical protein H6731_06200 [Myxococcales bacterium]